MTDSTWRLIQHPPQDGPTNMAIDQAILEAVGQGTAPPTLRFYAWQPACLSLGYGQRLREVDQARLAARGWHVVRRPTGGKAILHTDELTYSVCLPIDHPLAQGSITDSYRRLSAALQAGLEQLEVVAHITPRTAGGQATGPVCFEVPASYEVTAGGRKLIGSAQVRRHQAVLQHGTLPLHGDITRIVDVLVFDSEAAREAARLKVGQRATTVEAALGRRLTWQQTAAALSAAFATTFELQLVEENLTSAEQARAATLRASVYADPAWNARRR